MSNSAKSQPWRRRAAVSKDECPAALASAILGDRWTLLILREAFYGVVRYDDMREDLGAPRSMLTDRLKKMIEQGLMTRQSYQEPGDRVRQAYVLTEAGRALSKTFIALTEWSETHLTKTAAPVEFVDRETNEKVRCEIIDDRGKAVPLERVRMRVKSRKA